MDRGEPLITYTTEYWEMEDAAAIDRCYGASLARVAETFYYAKRPITHFFDIGTGTGLILDALKLYLPEHADLFYGVEKFPPEVKKRRKQQNYFIDGYQSCGVKFDAGTCIEMIEHLTPEMLRSLFTDIATVSNPGAAYLINTGLTKYAKEEDPGYLDPFVRGHIISWTMEALREVLHDLGFSVFPIRGKTWAVLVEYQSQLKETEAVTDRIWSALPENLAHLTSPSMGSVMRILGRESVRAYL